MQESSLIKKYAKEIDILKTLFGDAVEPAGGKGHRFFHQIRVAHTVKVLAQMTKFPTKNIDTLVLAALFHDIGKSPRIQSDGSLDGSQSADKVHGDHMDKNLVLELLTRYLSDLHPADKLDAISDIISSHDSDASKLLSYADNLDEVGLVNVWKMFTFGGAYKVDIAETIDYYFEEDRPRLLAKSDKELFFPISKRLAKTRIKRVDTFLRNLQEEILGKDI